MGPGSSDLQLFFRHGEPGLKRLKSYLDGAVHQYKDWNFKELNADNKEDLQSLPGYDEILHFHRCLNELIQEERKKARFHRRSSADTLPL